MNVGALACLLAVLLSACATIEPTDIDAAAADRLREQPERLIVVAVANRPAPLATHAGATPRAYGGQPNYTASDAAQALVAELAQDYSLRTITAWPIRPLALHCVVYELPPQGSRDAILARLAVDPRVRIAQPLQRFETLSSDYNDPYVDLQRGFAAIDAADAQRQSRGAGVQVAIIDTGIDAAHPDLRGRVLRRQDFVGGDAQPFELDRHGTEVAGVIAADANNGLGIVGVAPAVRLIALRACWQLAPQADGAACNSFTLAEALAAAIESDAQVLNLSLGGPADPLLSRLVAEAIRRGIIVVGAVPRDGRVDGFPLGVDGVLAVDVARGDGGDPARGERVLHAPGREILTLTPGGHYDFASGSSFAAAHVSGAIALLLAREPGLPAATVRRLLAGRGEGESINACAALAAVAPDTVCTHAGAAPDALHATTPVR